MPLAIISFFSRPIVTSCGTSLPSVIRPWHIFPTSEPEATSARSRSPAERCVYPYFSTMRSHCVPLPLPGPPSTKTISVSGSSAPSIAFCTSTNTSSGGGTADTTYALPCAL